MNSAHQSTLNSTIGRAHPWLRANQALSSLAPPIAAVIAERLFTTVIRSPVPVRERAWAAHAIETSFSSPHGRLAGWIWGNGPRTVLLVHGWGGRGLQMGAFAAPLADAGFRVVAFDGPSHGASPGRRANLFKLTEALVAVAHELGTISAIVGHSLGTAQVLLASSRGELDPAAFVAVAPMGDTRTMAAWFGRMTGFSPSVIKRMRHRLERRFDFSWDDVEPTRLGAGMRAETLVIHDRNDSELPWTEAENLARSIPSSRVHFTNGLGHRRILRDRGVVEITAGFVARRCAEPEATTKAIRHDRAPAA